VPKRSDIRSILILGAGPIVIGQACEFDYSGAQACKALKEEGYRVILVNSNPATIMTDPGMADATYIEPIDWRIVEGIVERERPDAILPTMGGQTALNCALDLHRHGVLERFDVELIGATPQAIDKAEDRAKFKEAMSRIGLQSARSEVAHTMAECWAVQRQLGFPVIIRPSFTMGGTGGGIARDAQEFEGICERGLAASPTSELLIEESLLGWKEFEMEVVRDHADNCIIVCSIENLDPMGVHTGDSITVAPAQTLTDKEYQRMRNASIAILREIGVNTGGSNVQFAIHPADGRMAVIEMNPRVSRSSALASKATGFPIAKVAAKLAVGYTLDELRNEITGGATPASFEPTIDYVVVKVPRFAFEKFRGAPDRLTTEMKSVGEVMAIGRTFQESFQKALRGLEIGVDGLEPRSTDRSAIERELQMPGPERIFHVADAFRAGLPLEEVQRHSAIDPWFLAQLQELVEVERRLASHTLSRLDREALRRLKQMGFSDRRIATLTSASEADVRERRRKLGVRPAYKRVDTCAAEFATSTAYLYSSYDQECEAAVSQRRKIVILGGGPNRIGQGIEFDYCCVHAALALREDGYETIMVNCNPETVSTDFDTSDRLYFEPLTLEDVLEIVAIERPAGVIVQYGGQTPLKLALALEAEGVPIIGTSPDMIDAAEDRERFQRLLQQLKLRQPPNRTARTEAEAVRMAREIGYPLVVRPSYVLGGRAMEIVYEQSELERYMQHAVKVSHDCPVLLDRFLEQAIEVDIDCIGDGRDVHIAGVMQHVEQAGIHSGDSACSLPPYSLSPAVVAELKRQTEAMARALKVVGLMNVQFAIQRQDGQDAIYVLEVNPRASRTVPFVSKATGVPVARIAARCMAGVPLKEQGIVSEAAPLHFSVKESVLPFNKFPGVDPILGPEMKSTGEVMGVGATFAEAYGRAQWAAGVRLPSQGTAYLRLREVDLGRGVDVARQLHALGYGLLADRATAAVLDRAGIPLAAPAQDHDSAVRAMSEGALQLVVVTADEHAADVQCTRELRLAALKGRAPLYTTIAAAEAVVQALSCLSAKPVRSLQGLAAAAAPDAARPADAAPLRLFIRQPLTESGQREQGVIARVLELIDEFNGAPRSFEYLTGRHAERADSFRQSFEQQTSRPFTPHNFRSHRLELLDQADLVVNIRVGMSESSAFELGYHIFAGRRTPVLFLVWRHAPIKTTLLRDLQHLCDVTYLEFDEPDDLRKPLQEHFLRLAASPATVPKALPREVAMASA
jgi:carbamoyl-phosphate synthase large subunit